ncbi:hypothetical protein [Microbacterium oxydans]|uniref:hypothetical protein n=1 Tax=Microbacterium oxydans TaxID=82380 RepID=UPI00226B3423|nr:hypothetical protein [Microbacterium oxydans]WAA65587.1 hypothetical protein MME74_15325 [Microbacterium oxydans]
MDDLKSGLFALLDGAEYEVVSTFGWSLRSWTPAPGFTKRAGKTGYFRAIDRKEGLPVFRIAHGGTYAGVPIQIASSGDGRVVAASHDPGAGDAGFTQHGRSEWYKTIDRSDPKLRIETTRTPVRAPWLA